MEAKARKRDDQTELLIEISSDTKIKIRMVRKERDQKEEINQTRQKCAKKVLTREELELRKERKRENYKKLDPEKKEKIKEKAREYFKKKYCDNIPIEQRREQKRETYKKLSLEKREKIRQRKRDYYQKINSEEFKMQNRERWREYYKKLTPEQKDMQRQKKNEYRMNRKQTRSEEQTELYNERRRERNKKLSAEEKEEKKKKLSEYFKKLSPEKREERNQKRRERRKRARIEKSNKEAHNSEDEYVEKYITSSEYNIGMIPQNFCYTCRVPFLNSTAFLEHIAEHVSLPFVVVSRIDRHTLEALCSKENEHTKMNNDLHSDTLQNRVNIKTEFIDCDKGHEVNNVHVNIKTENEIDFNNVPFYVCVKNEIERDCLSDEPH